MKLGCCSWSFGKQLDSGAMDMFEWMTVCARDLKLGGIELAEWHLMSLDEDYVRKLRRVAVDLQLTISALSVKNDFGLSDNEKRDKQIEETVASIELAAAIGAPVLRVFAGWPEENREKQWAEMARCLSVVCTVAEREGIVIALENNGPDGFIQTREDVERIMGDVDSDWLRLNLDTGNFTDGFDSIEKTIVYAVHAHAKVREVAPDGASPDVDLPRLADLLKEVNYRGFVSIEYCGEEDPATALPRSCDFIRRLLYSS